MKIKTIFSLISRLILSIFLILIIFIYFTLISIYTKLDENKIARRLLLTASELRSVTFKIANITNSGNSTDWWKTYYETEKTLKELAFPLIEKRYYPELSIIKTNLTEIKDFKIKIDNLIINDQKNDKSNSFIERNILLERILKNLKNIISLTILISDGIRNNILIFEIKIMLLTGYFLLFLIILSAIILKYLKRNISDPVSSLMQYADNIKNNIFNYEIIALPNNELGELSIVLNEMSKTLHQKTTQLNKQNEYLENEVKIKIQQLNNSKNELEDEVKKRTKELRLRIAELERYHDATINRELRIHHLLIKIAILEGKSKPVNNEMDSL